MKSRRILIAGHEIGGQMQLLAEAFRRKGYVAHAVAFNTDFRGYETDVRILSSRWPLKRLWFAVRAMARYDVFHFFWGVSLLDFWRFKGLDLPVLRLLGKTIVVHFRGTDLVDIRYYQYLNARAMVERIEEPPRMRPDQHQRLAQWRRYADRLLVSTPDLLELVPEATLVPQVVDVRKLATYRTQPGKGTFLLGHAPTRRTTKGTEFIIQAVERLKSKGVDIEIDLIENESPEGVLRRFARCDAGIDQLLHGWYGKVSVELMAIGKPVLCYLNPALKSPGIEPPIVNCDKESLEDVLMKMVTTRAFDPAPGYRYVEAHHDVHTIADRLLELYKVNRES